jgi:hypothetical protein
VIEKSESFPMCRQSQSGSVLAQTVNEVGREQGGNLQELVGKSKSFSGARVETENIKQIKKTK